MLRVNIHSKSFSRDMVIRDLDFYAEVEEIVAIVGPSGAGKSTLLNIIAGLDADFSGSVVLNPKAYSHCVSGTDQLSDRSNIAYMFQDPRLLPWRTVLENVCLVANHSELENQHRAKSLLATVGLAEHFNVYPGQLSGGMKRRVSLARAFLPKPSLVMMDEPFVSLDSPSAHSLRAYFLQLWKECGSTVIYVTHDLGEALAVADRVLFLSTSPATVILEVVVDEPSPTANEVKVVTALQDDLLTEFPNLLEGCC